MYKNIITALKVINARLRLQLIDAARCVGGVKETFVRLHTNQHFITALLSVIASFHEVMRLHISQHMAARAEQTKQQLLRRKCH